MPIRFRRCVAQRVDLKGVNNLAAIQRLLTRQRRHKNLLLADFLADVGPLPSPETPAAGNRAGSRPPGRRRLRA